MRERRTPNGSQFTWMGWPVPNVLLVQVNIGQIHSFLFLIFPGHTVIYLLNMHRRCWPKEDCDIQRQCTLKWTSKKSMIFGARCVSGLEVHKLVWVEATRQRQLLCYLARVGPMIIPLAQRSCWGVYWFHSVSLSVRLSVRPSRIPCPLCSTCSFGWIYFIFIHLIKQLQKVCHL